MFCQSLIVQVRQQWPLWEDGLQSRLLRELSLCRELPLLLHFRRKKACVKFRRASKMFDTAETSDQDPEQDIEMIATLNCVRRVLINQLVSKKKRRYKADGYNLDLSYLNHFTRTLVDPHHKILCMADKTKANDANLHTFVGIK